MFFEFILTIKNKKYKYKRVLIIFVNDLLIVHS